jgi:hypothetical protein
MTPIKGAAVGMQMFQYDTLHLAEFTRFLHKTEGKTVSNQDYANVLEPLIQMALVLPSMAKRS